MPIAVPDAAVRLIKHFEGCRLTPYRDSAGYWTVGWGHLVTRDRTAPQPPSITQEQADLLLDVDLRRTTNAVNKLLKIAITDYQRAALIDFAFNLGSGNLEASTLLRCVNRGDHDEVPAQLRRWVYSDGVKTAGLVRRREAEIACYFR